MTTNELDISSILTKLLHLNDVSESELSRVINIPRATINRLTSGKTPDPRASTLQAIANYFNISIDQLLGQKPLPINKEVINRVNTIKSVPVLKWEESLSWREIIPKNCQNYDTNFVTIESTNKNELFALIAHSNESMKPEFQENDILIIDPVKEPKNKNFVVAYINKKNEIVLRKLILEGKYRILKANNQLFPPFYLNNEDTIIGVVIQTRKSYE